MFHSSGFQLDRQRDFRVAQNVGLWFSHHSHDFQNKSSRNYNHHKVLSHSSPDGGRAHSSGRSLVRRHHSLLHFHHQSQVHPDVTQGNHFATMPPFCFTNIPEHLQYMELRKYF